MSSTSYTSPATLYTSLGSVLQAVGQITTRNILKKGKTPRSEKDILSAESYLLAFNRELVRSGQSSQTDACILSADDSYMDHVDGSLVLCKKPPRKFLEDLRASVQASIEYPEDEKQFYSDAIDVVQNVIHP